MATKIKLHSGDNKIFEVDIKVAKMSTTIKNMLEDLGTTEDTDELVPLPSIDSKILAKVVEWAEKHKDDPEPTEDDKQQKERYDIPEWDMEFLKVDDQTLFAIIRAANFLDIEGLMNLSCKHIANIIKGKTPEEIRKIFNLTPASGHTDDQAVKRKNQEEGESPGKTFKQLKVEEKYL